MRKVVVGLGAALLAVCAAGAAFADAHEKAHEKVKVNRAHAIAMHGSPKYAAGFTHFEYVNPAAPAGGKIVLSAFGSYDSFNPFILKGNPPAGRWANV